MTKSELVEIQQGEYPIFTAMQEPILHIAAQKKLPIIANQSNPILSFANDGDGSAGRNFVIHTTPFYINASRTAIKVLNENISIFYLLSQMDGMKERHGFNYGFKANRRNLSVVTVDIPLGVNGDFDLQEQTVISHQFSILKDMCREIVQRYRELAVCKICLDINADYDYRVVKVKDIFDIVRGSGKYTKSYTKKHEGIYPVYSGNTSREFAMIDTFDYDAPCISWAIDGLAGYIMTHNNPFSATNHRGVLFPTVDNVDIDYLKYTLEPIFRNVKKGRVGDNGENEYTSLPPFMIENIRFEIPVNGDGNFDIVAQREIAQKYITIEQYKHEILEKLNALIMQKVEL